MSEPDFRGAVESSTSNFSFEVLEHPGPIKGVFVSPDAALTGDNLKVTGMGCGLYVGRGSHVHASISIVGENSIVIIGDRCRIRRTTISVFGDNIVVIIGSDVTSEALTVLSNTHGKRIEVGDDCMISSAVVIRTDDGHAIFDRVTKTPINDPGNVIIGRHVWVGNGARVNKGTVIGAGCVIGQMSVVSGHLEENCIYAGVPAKKIRDGVVWSRSLSFDDIPALYR